MALSAGLGYGFDAYAVNIYSLVLPLIAISLHLSLGLQGLIGSIFLVGYTIGTIGFGIAADRFGRWDSPVTCASSLIAGTRRPEFRVRVR